MKELTPREIMRELNRYIIGQDAGQAGGGHRSAQPLPPQPSFRMRNSPQMKSVPRTS